MVLVGGVRRSCSECAAAGIWGEGGGRSRARLGYFGGWDLGTGHWTLDTGQAREKIMF